MASLKDLIKTALKKAGLKEDLADELEKKVKSEEEIEAAVGELKKKEDEKTNLTDEDFEKTVEKAGLTETLKKYVKTREDRVAQKAVQTHDEKLKEKADEARQKAEEDEAKKKEQEKMTAEQKEISSLKDTVKELKDTIGQFLNKTSENELKTKFKVALKEAKLKETWADKISITKEEEIETHVNEIQELVTTREQEATNKILEELNIPKDGNGQTTTLTEDLVADFAERQEKGNISGDDFKGKDLGLGETENIK